MENEIPEILWSHTRHWPDEVLDEVIKRYTAYPKLVQYVRDVWQSADCYEHDVLAFQLLKELGELDV